MVIWRNNPLEFLQVLVLGRLNWKSAPMEVRHHSTPVLKLCLPWKILLLVLEPQFVLNCSPWTILQHPKFCNCRITNFSRWSNWIVEVQVCHILVKWEWYVLYIQGLAWSTRRDCIYVVMGHADRPSLQFPLYNAVYGINLHVRVCPFKVLLDYGDPIVDSSLQQCIWQYYITILVIATIAV